MNTCVNWLVLGSSVGYWKLFHPFKVADASIKSIRQLWSKRLHGSFLTDVNLA